MRYRTFATVVATALVLASCGGGTKIDDSASGGGGGGGDAPTTTAAADDACAGQTLEATEVGVDPTTITVAAIADTGSSIRPGLFQGSVDGVKAWAEYMNEQRRARLPPDRREGLRLEAVARRREERLAAACGDSVAMVGTTALFLNDVAPMETCKDKAGAATGIPDIAGPPDRARCTSARRSRSPRCRPAAPCPYSGAGERDVPRGRRRLRLLPRRVPDDDLHGVCVIPKDLPSTIAATMPVFRLQPGAGHQERRRVRRQRPRHAVGVHAVRAGDQANKLDLRPQRPRLRGHRVHAQGGADRRASTR